MKKFLMDMVNDDKSTYYLVSFFVAVAILFSFLYYSIVPFFEGHQALAHNLRASDRALPATYLDCFYFSITTQTTLGYGDIVAASVPAKVCSIVQSVFGYFYLAFSIAIFACKGIMRSKKFELLLRAYKRDVRGMNEYSANN